MSLSLLSLLPLLSAGAAEVHAAIAEEAEATELDDFEQLSAWCEQRVLAFIDEELQRCDTPHREAARERLALDAELNGQGLAVAAMRARKGK